MKDRLTIQDVTPEVQNAVHELITSMAIAKTMRAKVDAIQRTVLQDIALYNDLEVELSGPRRLRVERTRIYDPKHSYQSEDDAAINAYYAACDAAERAAGLKPDGMDLDHCPALVAEHEQLKAEWNVLDAAAVMLDLEFDGQELNNRLLCEKNGKGLEQRRQFLDLVIGAVVNLPA